MQNFQIEDSIAYSSKKSPAAGCTQKYKRGRLEQEVEACSERTAAIQLGQQEEGASGLDGSPGDDIRDQQGDEEASAISQYSDDYVKE